VAAAVEEVFVHPYDGSGMVTINDQVVATVNHPFFAIGGFVRADDLAMSDSLLTLPQTFSAGDDYAMSLVPGAIVTLTSTGDLTPARVYNLAVREHHTYFAGGILVHNMIYKY
jgi:intein/homing endonuclease